MGWKEKYISKNEFYWNEETNKSRTGEFEFNFRKDNVSCQVVDSIYDCEIKKFHILSLILYNTLISDISLPMNIVPIHLFFA